MLLNTLRKTTMKVLTNRLSRILIKHSILKGRNYAGLPGGSTEIPIKLMQMVMKDAKYHKKSLWILLQDLSKAYDRVDINILKLAMIRIKLFPFCISFILDFFIHCKNAVYTADGITDYY